MLYKFAGILIASAFFAGCTSVDSQTRTAAAPEPAISETDTGNAVSQATPEEKEKMSLDAALDEHDKIIIVDDDTYEEKLICRRIEPPTGTRFGNRKLCATRKQWDAQAQKAEDTLNDIVRKRSGGEFNQ